MTSILINALSALNGGGITYLYNIIKSKPLDYFLVYVLVSPENKKNFLNLERRDIIIIESEFAGKSVFHRFFF